MTDAVKVRPYIYALMICSKVQRDPQTGGWQIFPLNHVAVRSMPTTLNLTFFVGVMGPAATYQLQFRLIHADEAIPTTLMQPVNLPVQANKNVEYVGQVSVTLKNAGLYLVEAALPGLYSAYAPLRLSPVSTPATPEAQG